MPHPQLGFRFRLDRCACFAWTAGEVSEGHTPEVDIVWRRPSGGRFTCTCSKILEGFEGSPGSFRDVCLRFASSRDVLPPRGRPPRPGEFRRCEALVERARLARTHRVRTSRHGHTATFAFVSPHLAMCRLPAVGRPGLARSADWKLWSHGPGSPGRMAYAHRVKVVWGGCGVVWGGCVCVWPWSRGPGSPGRIAYAHRIMGMLGSAAGAVAQACALPMFHLVS